MPKFRTLVDIGGHPVGTVLEGRYSDCGEFVKVPYKTLSSDPKEEGGWLKEKFEEVSEDTEVTEKEKTPMDSEKDTVDPLALKPKESVIDASMDAIRDILVFVESSSKDPEATAGTTPEIHFSQNTRNTWLVYKGTKLYDGDSYHFEVPELKTFKNYGFAKRHKDSLPTSEGVSYGICSLSDLKLTVK